jgi:uncharacterized protein (DUF4415 family)
MKKEYDLRKLKLKRRGAVVTKTAKVMKTLRLDAEVLRWLMEKAAERGIGYQTLLNMILRDAMRRNAAVPGDLRAEIQAIVREELRRAS